VDERIAFYIPEFGMNGGGNYNVVPANAPHPAAALVFMNWVSSAEVQTRFNEVFGAAPMHPEADDSNALVPNEMRQFSDRLARQPVQHGNPPGLHRERGPRTLSAAQHHRSVRIAAAGSSRRKTRCLLPAP
jgi:ABC-type uncharacterized transport system YnjBCD substrate-binding protein